MFQMGLFLHCPRSDPVSKNTAQVPRVANNCRRFTPLLPRFCLPFHPTSPPPERRACAPPYHTATERESSEDSKRPFSLNCVSYVVLKKQRDSAKIDINPPCHFGDRARGFHMGASHCFKRSLLHPKRTNVYIDGFNLYYGAVKDTPYKWLDLVKFCRIILPKNTVHHVKYFTALVSATPTDPTKPNRQQTYIRALQTLPNLEVIYGHFLRNRCRMPLAVPLQGGAKTVEVIKTEEKGSDVNLATHLLNDAWRGKYEIAVVVTNDSDLCEPIRIIQQELQKTVGIVTPHKIPSRQLLSFASFSKKIRTKDLQQSQFPQTLTDENGVITKPSGW
jgi:hypothetical protein